MTTALADVVLRSLSGGLGDHLFLSPIPRLLKEQRPGIRVFISTRSPFRSPETKRLVWDSNPFVDGFVDAPGFELMAVSDHGNFLARCARSLGLDAPDDLEPELHVDLELIDSIRGTTLVDLNYTSFVGAFSRRRVRDLVRDLVHERDSVVLVNPPRWARDLGGSITTTSLVHYAALIASAERFVCFTSGGATLAAALGRPAVCLYGYGQTLAFHHSRLHTYVDVSVPRFVARPMALALKVRNRIRHAMSSAR